MLYKTETKSSEVEILNEIKKELAKLKIESSTAGVGFVTTALSGNGYNPGAPPVLQFASVTPYNGTTGVNPAAGQTGNYTYKILYKSSNNRAPSNPHRSQ